MRCKELKLLTTLFTHLFNYTIIIPISQHDIKKSNIIYSFWFNDICLLNFIIIKDIELVYKLNMPKNKSINPIHDLIIKYTQNFEIANDYDRYFKDNPLFVYDCQYIHEQLESPCTVLDLGCGSGRHMLFLESLGFKTFGIDLSEHFLKTSKRKLKSFGCCPEKLIQADIMHLPLNKNIRFDAVIMMFSVLGLIQGHNNRKSILASIRASMAPESKLIIHVHNYEFRYSAMTRRLNTLKNNLFSKDLKETGDKIVYNYRKIQDIYIHSFTFDEICGLLKESGYNINDIQGLNTRRDGPCQGEIRKNANGFLITAIPEE